MALVTEVIEPGQPNRSFEDSIHGFPYITGLEQQLTGFECNDLTPIGQGTHRVQSERDSTQNSAQGSGACCSQGQGGTKPRTDIIRR
jgi:hypothetical protein